MVFEHINNCCTRNGNGLDLLIMTGNAHKEKCCNKLSFILEKIGGGGNETQSKMIMVAKWLVFLQSQK